MAGLSQRLAALPREVRDTLFLLAVIAWVIAPHAAHLPLWCSIMAAGILIWRAVLALQARPLPSLPWRLLLLIGALAGTWWSHHSIVGREGGVTLAVVLLCMKTLELRAQRDAFVVFFFGFFIIVTNFLFSQTLLLALAMLLGLWGLLAALVNAHLPAGRPRLAQPIRTAGRLMLLGAPIMAALFVLFPRFAPLWGMPGDQAAGKTGLSDSMQVGQVASLALDDGIAFRIKFQGAAPPKSQLYFRGPVLSVFDGQRWQMEPAPPSLPLGTTLPLAPPERDPNSSPQGSLYRYQITLEPSYRPWLMALEAPVALQPPADYPAALSPDLQLLTRRPASDLLRYSASSQTPYHYGADLPLWQQRALARLPAGSNPRTQAWMAQWLAQARAANPQADASATTLALSQYLLHKLATEDYHYTLEPGLFGRDSADEFWFDKKQGFCEHIASSFVIAMRAAGVPARLVTGYQGAQENALDGYWVVRHSDAHAWAEIWLPQEGWRRVDPTAAIAPWRVDLQQRRLSAPPSALGTLIDGAVSPTLLLRLRSAWEASNNAWNQWVLNYSQTRQLDALKKWGFDDPSWQSLVQVLGFLLAAAALLGGAWGYWQKRHIDPWLRLLQQARQRLARAGIPSTDANTPRQIAQTLAPGVWVDWLLALEAQRYRASDSNTLSDLARTLKRLPKLAIQAATEPNT